jgi:rfaE bifunctional protein kinase chain/domain
MSPEAPVPVVDVMKRDARLGGAANVALNIKSSGATPIVLTVLGSKGRAHEFLSLMDAEGMSTVGLVQSEERRCTIKTRVISNDKHMMRVDEEDLHPLSALEEEKLLLSLERLLAEEKIGAIILQDYNKGVLTPIVITKVTERARHLGIPVMVDPKKANFLTYKNCTLFKPNLKELREGLGIELASIDCASLDSAVIMLRSKMPHRYTLITLSEHGVYWNDGEKSGIIPVFKRNIVDVSGAGDTVISLAALALTSGVNLEQASLIADLGGGLVCEEVGVQPIRKELLIKEVEDLKL